MIIAEYGDAFMELDLEGMVWRFPDHPFVCKWVHRAKFAPVLVQLPKKLDREYGWLDCFGFFAGRWWTDYPSRDLPFCKVPIFSNVGVYLLDRGCLYAGVFTNCVDLIDTDPMFLK
jgi:hypothetical protein